MSKYLIVGVLIVGVAIAAYVGCDGFSNRMDVAADKAIQKIDNLLGEMDVKQKAVENAYDDLKSLMAGVREKRIEAEVRVKSMNEKRDAMADKKTKIVKNLSKLQELLKEAEASGSIERNGKEVSVDQLKSMAEGSIREMKLLKDQLTKNNVIATAWAKNLQVLKKQEDTSTTQLKKLESQLDQIRSKKSALDAMKEAANIAGPGASISDKFNDLTESVDELLVNIDTKFSIEEAKLDERAAQMEQDATIDIEDILNDKTDVSGTLSEIDKLLNEGN
ncbi:MAG: hypothetical protein AAFN77_01765 [Planctomycetota bacterium]